MPLPLLKSKDNLLQCIRIRLIYTSQILASKTLPSKATKTVCRRKTEKKIGRIGVILATPAAKINFFFFQFL